MSFEEYGGRTHSFYMQMRSVGPSEELLKTKFFKGINWQCGLVEKEAGMSLYLECLSPPFANITLEFFARYDVEDTWEYKPESLMTKNIESDGKTRIKCYCSKSEEIKKWLDRENAVFYVWVRITPAVMLKTDDDEIRVSKPDVIQQCDRLRNLILSPDNRHLQVVTLDCFIRSSDLRAFLSYMFETRTLTAESVTRVVHCASQLNCPEVVRKCELHILDNKDSFDFDERELLAYQFELHELRTDCREEVRQREKERDREQARERAKERARERTRERANEKAKNGGPARKRSYRK